MPRTILTSKNHVPPPNLPELAEQCANRELDAKGVINRRTMYIFFFMF